MRSSCRDPAVGEAICRVEVVIYVCHDVDAAQGVLQVSGSGALGRITEASSKRKECLLLYISARQPNPVDQPDGCDRLQLLTVDAQVLMQSHKSEHATDLGSECFWAGLSIWTAWVRVTRRRKNKPSNTQEPTSRAMQQTVVAEYNRQKQCGAIDTKPNRSTVYLHRRSSNPTLSQIVAKYSSSPPFPPPNTHRGMNECICGGVLDSGKWTLCNVPDTTCAFASQVGI